MQTFTQNGLPHRLLMDNDPKHTSKLFREFMERNSIIHYASPPQSPDITSGIECVWHELKYFLNIHVKPRNKEELVQGILSFWDERLSIDQCNRYINHKFNTLPSIILHGGEATGF